MSAVIVFLFALTMLTTAVTASWPQFGSDESNNAVTSAQTPAGAQEAELVFKTVIRSAGSWDGISNIVVAGSYLYVAVGDTLFKLDKNGSITADATLAASVSSSPFIAYGEGMIFAFVSDGINGYIQSVNAASMKIVAVSRPFPGMECFSPITYHEGRVYLAVSGYDYSSWSILPGVIIGIDASLEDNGSMFILDSGLSYYWNGTAVAGSRVIAGSREGVVQVIGSGNGNIIDQIDVGEGIRTSISMSGSTAYFGTGEGSVGRIGLAGDGSMDKGSLKLVSLGSQVTTTPVVYKGRIYAGTGDFIGGTGLYVIDADTMTVSYSVQIPGTDSWSGAAIDTAGIQTSPVLSSAYGSDLYVYFSINAKPGALMVLKDNALQSNGEVTVVFSPDESDSNSAIVPLSAGDDGTVYYINDSGILFAIGKEKTVDVPAPLTGTGKGLYLFYIMAAALAGMALLSVGRIKRHQTVRSKIK